MKRTKFPAGSPNRISRFAKKRGIKGFEAKEIVEEKFHDIFEYSKKEEVLLKMKVATRMERNLTPLKNIK